MTQTVREEGGTNTLVLCPSVEEHELPVPKVLVVVSVVENGSVGTGSGDDIVGLFLGAEFTAFGKESILDLGLVGHAFD
ncbi:hypothetical protein VSDG_04406 [Cytospora chrysosperma]|uniref:Uncharacterized protein n=1 Tax=Cytospora chrysosperma TaxID=252740 RepID=A0A423W4M0_CYTCH|nr:hypothetical protein VSDG_04406 [Valsa sordida]